MKKLWKVTLWAIALLSALLVLGGCGGDKSEEDLDKKPGGTHTCVGETWVTEKEATCKEEGSKTLVCACGKTVKTEVIPLGNHNLVNGTCTVCGGAFVEIRTVADLKNVSSNLSANYILLNDLDLGGREWSPIGTSSDNPFTGTFDGNGHTISNFKITGDVQYAGLFGYNKGTIQNLGVESFMVDVSRSGTVSAGGLVGENCQGTIFNCYTTGDVSGTSSGAETCAGGLVGYNYEGTITNSYAMGGVSGTSLYSADAGGLVGGCLFVSNGEAIVMNCYATGAVSASSISSSSFAGGLIGFKKGSVTNCYATGAVSASSASSSSFAGGLIGCNGYGSIKNSYATGAVSNTSSDFSAYAGGLVGENEYGAITNCYATGGVSASSAGSHAYAWIGGIAGHNTYGTITNCYRYSGQSFTVTVNGTTTYSATNTAGTAKDMATLQSVDFQKNTLTWSSDDWNFAEGAHPTLK